MNPSELALLTEDERNLLLEQYNEAVRTMNTVTWVNDTPVQSFADQTEGWSCV